METSSTLPPQNDSRQGASASIPSSGDGTQPTTTTLHISDRAALAAAWRSPHPILTHLNADTTWILHIPYPKDATRPPGKSRFNVLMDPWLQGPQSDGGRFFSIQWHVVAPSVQTIKELNELLSELEKDAALEQGAETRDYIDVVAISHEFTDHCHKATLRELPASTPVFAPDKAAKLIRSWKHFDGVVDMPPFSASGTIDWREALSCAPLPSWVGIGRVITPGNALYYHAAVIVAWANSTSEGGDAIIYSPHGIQPEGLSGMQATKLRTLALLHGLDDVHLWMTKQLNLGGVNGVSAARASGAKYWVATHDEVKKGGGFVSLLLRRTSWSVADAVKKEGRKRISITKKGEDANGYEFVGLGSGDSLVLS